MKLKPLLIASLALGLLLLPLFHGQTRTYAWGLLDHQIITSRADDLLPDGWREFFNYYEWLLNETSVYPDTVYRELDPEENPRHWINLEVWDPKKPQSGTLPFAIERFAREMEDALRRADWNHVFIAAGRLSHYMADIHQPYHSTVNYDPKNRQGASLHSLLDRAIRTHLNEIRLITREQAPSLEPIANLTEFVFYIARQSHSFLAIMNRTLIEEGLPWSQELTRIVENRTNTAIVSVARVWYTAILKSNAQPPTIPAPNQLKIVVEGLPRELNPEELYLLKFTVADGLGVRVISEVKATAGVSPAQVFGQGGVMDPFGRYVVHLTPSHLRPYAGGLVEVVIVAEREGYASGSLTLTVKVAERRAPPAPGPILGLVEAIVIGAVAVVISGAVLLVVRRTRREGAQGNER